MLAIAISAEDVEVKPAADVGQIVLHIRRHQNPLVLESEDATQLMIALGAAIAERNRLDTAILDDEGDEEWDESYPKW